MNLMDSTRSCSVQQASLPQNQMFGHLGFFFMKSSLMVTSLILVYAMLQCLSRYCKATACRIQLDVQTSSMTSCFVVRKSSLQTSPLLRHSSGNSKKPSSNADLSALSVYIIIMLCIWMSIIRVLVLNYTVVAYSILQSVHSSIGHKHTDNNYYEWNYPWNVWASTWLDCNAIL